MGSESRKRRPNKIPNLIPFISGIVSQSVPLSVDTNSTLIYRSPNSHSGVSRGLYDVKCFTYVVSYISCSRTDFAKNISLKRRGEGKVGCFNHSLSSSYLQSQGDVHSNENPRFSPPFPSPLPPGPPRDLPSRSHPKFDL